MRILFDPDVNALYIEVRHGRVARTVELTDTVYVDMDNDDAPLGIEFVNADEFVPFLRDHANDAHFPPQVREIFQGSAG